MNQTEQVLLSPDGRFKRLNSVISSVNSSLSFLGLDQDTGSEIVWTVVSRNLINKTNQDALIQCLYGIQKISDASFLQYKAIWEDRECIYIITEKPDKLLSIHSKRIRYMSKKLIRKWTKEILEIIAPLQGVGFHSGITIDSFYVNTSTGAIKYGTIGAPEFQEADILRDLWSFGIVVLELIGLDSSKPRQSLESVKDRELKGFLESCMFRVSKRLSFTTLLQDSIFKQVDPIYKQSPGGMFSIQEILLLLL